MIKITYFISNWEGRGTEQNHCYKGGTTYRDTENISCRVDKLDLCSTRHQAKPLSTLRCTKGQKF